MAPYAESKGVPTPGVSGEVIGAATYFGRSQPLLGVKPKLGVLLIIGFLAGVSPSCMTSDAMKIVRVRMNDMINFAKNLALAGGALALLGVDEPWEASLTNHQSELIKKVRKIGRESAAYR